ncbi:uncharacterized protein LOC126748769 [Anthonomus grandis grandis]|uniref:uncharacterized protein LOC126748769 n=1 Tax=Anthonomus grandis grandis TaxID=2921223 RepID=UPI002166916E|nr:uncharacterized protein LOC126748769 [Anthonomus grandis grandis]XP_050314183.1 uncharacterized protein LOC126748769 [Anthonomus grandis grandis]
MDFPIGVNHNGNISDISMEEIGFQQHIENDYVAYNCEEIENGNLNSNITDLVLEDGTRAMIVDGTLVTANGQTLLLQDGTDLSQYSFDENTEQIVISKEQEDQFLQDISSSFKEDPILENAQENQQSQMLYIKNDDNFIHQEQINEISNVPLEDLPLEDDQNLVSLRDGYELISIGQLLLDGAAQLDNSNYQFAILKDGKFYLQAGNNDLVNALHFNEEEVEDVAKRKNLVDLDPSVVTGRNIKTGQVISLSNHMSKIGIQNIESSVLEKKFKVESAGDLINMDDDTPSRNLTKLINKKITIGQTDKGKRLVGKIVNVLKKADVTKKAAGEILNEPVENRLSEVEEALNLVESEGCDILPVNTAIPKDNIIDRDFDNKPNSRTVLDNQSTVLQKTAESSKIIVQEKMVTKDCFNVISKTISGLMNMDSVVKKLQNKIIIIKIVEKTFNHAINDYSKTISYCSGCMVREYQLDAGDGTYSETWKFNPDQNAKETILGQETFELSNRDREALYQNSKKYANLTIQITTNPNGHKQTKVFINPPALFQCKACCKSFRTSALLKVHSLECHTNPVQWFSCEDCLQNFKTVEELSKHSRTHLDKLGAKKNGMYQCMECHMSFSRSFEIRRHMDRHYKASFTCQICKKTFNTIKMLNKHKEMHTYQPKKLNAILKGQSEPKPQPRKTYSCNICKRQFSRHSNLLRHVEIHQGEGAMYQCAVCGCSYHYISSLTRHVVSCHVTKAKERAHQQPTVQQLQESINSTQDEDLQFLQEDQIVQMIPLDSLTESLQNYEGFQFIDSDFPQGLEGVQIFQVPIEAEEAIEN